MNNSRQKQIKMLWGDYLSGFFACWIIDIGSRLNFFEIINNCKEGISAGELAKRLSLDSHLVKIWCKAAYSFNLLELNENGYFRLDESMESLLIRESKHPDDFIAGTIETYVGASKSFFHFYEALKTGKTVKLEDMEQFYHNSVEKATLTMLNYLISHVIIDDPDLKKIADKRVKVLDFGCGTGLGMIQYAKAFKNWGFLGVDINQTLIHKAKENIKSNGLEDRIKVKVVTPCKFDLGQDFDLILLTFTLHEMKNREAMLKEFLKLLKKNGNLLIFEFVWSEDIRELRTFSGRIVMGEQIAEAILGNTLISASEMKELLKTANYRNLREYDYFDKAVKIYIAQKSEVLE